MFKILLFLIYLFSIPGNDLNIRYEIEIPFIFLKIMLTSFSRTFLGFCSFEVWKSVLCDCQAGALLLEPLP
jgi:hypothetical protein